MSTTRVTIGVCVKNSGSSVKDALESITSQDFPHEVMEIIVVDGSSVDNTMAIVRKSLEKSDIKSRFFCENHGLGAARNIVINNSEGDYIIWVDSDMLLPNDHVRKQVNFMDNNPKVGIAGGKFKGWSGDNTIATIESMEWEISDYLRNSGASFSPIKHFCGGTIYRLKAIKSVGGFNENIRGAAEDWDAESRIGKKGWLLYFTTDAVFFDKRRTTLLELWHENYWYGYGAHFTVHKQKRKIHANVLLESFSDSKEAYKKFRKKVAFLMPVQRFFKKIAWGFGYMRSNIDGYGHS